MKLIPDRLVWAFWRRHRLKISLPHFWASFLSYACRNTKFSGYHSVKKGTELYSVSVGCFTYFAENVRARHCQIGPLCSIGPDVILGDLPKHPTDYISTHPLFYSSNNVAGISFNDRPVFQEYITTIVGGDVFVGARALIMPGVTLGHGCMIGAGAVVTRDVPPFAIVAGVPAKLLRYRFANETIDELLQTQWWNWPIEKLRKWQLAWKHHETISPMSVRNALVKANLGDGLL